jgi:hypothetical protein
MNTLWKPLFHSLKGREQQVFPIIEVSPSGGKTAHFNTIAHVNEVCQLHSFILSATVDPENGCFWNAQFRLAQYKPLF